MSAIVRKIDVHHHIIPDFYQDILAGVKIPVGISLPMWSPEASLALMDELHIETSIISLSAPGAVIAGHRNGVRELVRKCNDYAAALRDAHPDRFGFFAALPGLMDQEGAIVELKHALETLKADGVTLFTSYGGKYLGAKEFETIWCELDRLHTVVHIHPIHSAEAPFTTPFLPQPLIDYPHETARTASDLVLSGRKRQFPHCRVILSHAGGTMPYLAERLTVLANGMCSGLLDDNSSRGGQIMEDLRSFYFDLALGSSANVLDSLLKWAPSDHILYGSDFPYAVDEAKHFDGALTDYAMDDRLRELCYNGNALRLFSRLRVSEPELRSTEQQGLDTA
ncbi:MAG: hypothetical protein Q9218_002088 [Villophora microphyllina]